MTDIKDVAKEIRVILSNSFHKTKFSVRCSRFSQGSSVDITWTDGPTEKQVDDLVKHFGNPRTRFIHSNRQYSKTFINSVTQAWKGLHPEYAHLTINAVKNNDDVNNCYFQFDYTEFSSNPNLRLFEVAMREIMINSVIEGDELKIVAEYLVSNNEITELTEKAQEQQKEEEKVEPKKLTNRQAVTEIIEKLPNCSVKTKALYGVLCVEIDWKDGNSLKNVEKIVKGYENCCLMIKLNRKYSEEFTTKLIKLWKEQHFKLNLSINPFSLNPLADNYIYSVDLNKIDSDEIKVLVGESLKELFENSSYRMSTVIYDANQLPIGQKLFDKVLEQEKEEKNNNVIEFKKPDLTATVNQGEEPEVNKEGFYQERYEQWVKALIERGDYKKVKSFDEWYSVASDLI